MSLEILYEDNHIIVCVKPVGILSQEDYTKDMDMLTLIKQYIKDVYNKPGNVYLGLVHRLDRMTGGVMVFAKTSKAASRLNEQVRNHIFKKKYYAVVKGIINEDGHLENYLIKDEKEVKSYVGNSKSGKLAVLDYKVVNIIDGNTLIDISLKTGRHHQIRVQFSNINHPLIGDSLYGETSKTDLMLYAYSLTFNHPISKEELVFEKKPNINLWNKYF